MYLLSYRSLILVWVSIVFFSVVCIASANTLQVTPTVTLVGSENIQEGAVVVLSTSTQTYQLSEIADAPEVFGVVALRPALVFSTGDDEVPVVTEGVAKIQVNGDGGPITRGDLLVTSSSTGIAMRAKDSNIQVFAVALEGYQGTTTGLIQADIGAERAQSLRESPDVSGQKERSFSLMRMVVAAILAVGALFFVLYSFRSTIAQGVVSVGRNPRARSSIMTLAFGNIIFALILFVIIIFVAVAILVLPV